MIHYNVIALLCFSEEVSRVIKALEEHRKYLTYNMCSAMNSEISGLFWTPRLVVRILFHEYEMCSHWLVRVFKVRAHTVRFSQQCSGCSMTLHPSAEERYHGCVPIFHVGRGLHSTGIAAALSTPAKQTLLWFLWLLWKYILFVLIFKFRTDPHELNFF